MLSDAERRAVAALLAAGEVWRAERERFDADEAKRLWDAEDALDAALADPALRSLSARLAGTGGEGTE